MVIYMATCVITGKSYVGLSTKSLASRQYAHHRASKTNSPNLFHFAINKYGKDSITWVVLEDGIEDFSVLQKREQYWIKEKNTFRPNGYNLTLGGEGAYGHVVREEVKKSMGVANIGKTPWNKGQPTPEEIKKKIGDANRGRKMTEEERKCITEINRARGLARIGTHRSPETVEKMRKAATGRIQSEEQKQKQRIAMTGRTLSEETRQKIREIRTGTHQLDSTKLKISMAKKGKPTWNKGKRPSEEAIAKQKQTLMETLKRKKLLKFGEHSDG